MKINKYSIISVCLIWGSALITCIIFHAIPNPWVLLFLFASPFFFLPLLFISGIIFGHVALRQIKKQKNKGKKATLVSIAFGYFVIGATLLSLLITDLVAH